MTDFTGRRLGRYLIEEKLGEGGMAVVYRASDERLGRSVAVKVIRVDLFPTASLDAMLKRFDREARALASLTHANIVGVIDYGESEGSPYLVMEYLPGGSLKDRMGTPMAFLPAARIATVVAGALDYAHAKGIIHRDVKPSNILLTSTGDPMLSDFGIAKLLELDEGSAALTSSGMAIGTPEYMAPEQWMGRTGPASDQYSLGIILYELVAGRKPYTSATPGELLLKQATQPLPMPHEFAEDLPDIAEQVIVRALAREPAERYADLKAFAAALEEAARSGQTGSGTLWPRSTQTPGGEDQALRTPTPPPVVRAATPLPGATPPPYTPPPYAPPPGNQSDYFTPAREKTPPPQATPPPVVRAATPLPGATPPPYTPPPGNQSDYFTPAREKTPPPQATPPPVGRAATPLPGATPPAYTPAPSQPGINRYPPPPNQSHSVPISPARAPAPAAGYSAAGMPAAGMRAAGMPAAAPRRRVPVVWIAGGLLAAVLVVGLFAAGLIFIASRGLRNGNRQATPTQAAMVQPTTAQGKPSPVKPAADATQVAAPGGPTQPVAAAPPGDLTGTLHINLETFPDSLDPQKVSTTGEVSHVNMLYEGLTRLDENLSTVPGAAERWEYSDDLLTLTFTLRDGLQYSDGSPLNARRFEYSILRNLDPAMGGDYSSITDEIAGAPAYRGADPAKTGPDVLEKLRAEVGVHALDPSGQPCKSYEQPDCLVLKIAFSNPAPYFHTVMSLWAVYPAKEELITRGGAEWWKDPASQIGNGPMVLAELEMNKRTLYKPNLHYWRGTARVELEYLYINDNKEALQAYKDGALDIIPLTGEYMTMLKQGDPELAKQALIYPGSCTSAFIFHSFKPPFNDLAVREAFSHTLDRNGFVKEVLMSFASPTQTWIPKGFPGYDAEERRFPYDPIKAQAILNGAGYTITNGQLNKGGKTYPITLTYSNTARNSTRFEWIAAKWKADLGLEVALNPVESDAYTQLSRNIDTAPQTYILGWCADYPDPQNWLSVYWKSESAFARRVGFKDPALDKLLEQADRERDPARRMDLYAEAQKMLIGDAPGVFLWNNINVYLVKPLVKGMRTTPQDASWPGDLDPLGITIEK